MCKQIQHVSDGTKIGFIRVGNRHLTDGLAVRKSSVFKGSRLLSSSTINSTVGTNQVNIGQRCRYIFDLCVTCQISGLQAVPTAKGFHCTQWQLQFIGNCSVAYVILTHQSDPPLLIFCHGMLQSEGACIVHLLQNPQDKNSRFGNRDNKKAGALPEGKTP